MVIMRKVTNAAWVFTAFSPGRERAPEDHGVLFSRAEFRGKP
jgi:hypothetical protein